MKKIYAIVMLIALVGLVFGCCPANGQNNKVISLDTAGMPAAVKAAINEKMKTDEITNKIETYGKWAGMGKEIGVAAREGLGAVKDVAIDLSNSQLGKTVMFLIIWKVAGIDMVRIIIAVFFAIISIWLISKSYFRAFSTRTLTEKSGWWIFGTKKYTYREVPDDVFDGANNSWAAALHWIFLCVMLGIAAIVAFA
jgi:hypothetical protein